MARGRALPGKSWKELCYAIEAHARGLKADGGAKLAFLVEPSASPLLASLQADRWDDFADAEPGIPITEASNTAHVVTAQLVVNY